LPSGSPAFDQNGDHRRKLHDQDARFKAEPIEDTKCDANYGRRHED